MRAWIAGRRMLALVALVTLVTGCGDRGELAPMLVQTTNSVRLNDVAVAVAAPKMLALSPGDVLDVDPGAIARLLYRDGTKVLLVGRKERPARMKIEPKGGSDTGRALLKLLTGTLSFLVPPARPGKREYHIEASSTLTMVRGTSGRITTTPEEDRIALASGHVEVHRLGSEEHAPLKELEELIAPARGAFQRRVYSPASAEEMELYDVKIDRTRHGF